MPKKFKQWICLTLIGILVAPTVFGSYEVYAQGEDISPIESVEFGQPTESDDTPSESEAEETPSEEKEEESVEEEETSKESEETSDDSEKEEEETSSTDHPVLALMERLSQMQTGIVSDYTIVDYLEDGQAVLAETATLIKDGDHYLLTDQQDQKVPYTVLVVVDEETEDLKAVYEPVKDLIRNVNHALEQEVEDITSELEALTELAPQEVEAVSNLYIDQSEQKDNVKATLDTIQQTGDFLFLLGQQFITQPGRVDQLEELAPGVYQLEITDEVLDDFKQLISEEKEAFESLSEVISLFENGQASTMLFNTTAMEYGIGTLSEQSAIEYYFSAQGRTLRLPEDDQIVTLDDVLTKAEEVEEAEEPATEEDEE